jgi:hypothetical protein
MNLASAFHYWKIVDLGLANGLDMLGFWIRQPRLQHSQKLPAHPRAKGRS